MPETPTTHFLRAVAEAAHLERVREAEDQHRESFLRRIREGADSPLDELLAVLRPLLLELADLRESYSEQSAEVAKLAAELAAWKADVTELDKSAWNDSTFRSDALEVLTYVSRGRGHVGTGNYPDFSARRALGRLPGQDGAA